MSPDEPHSDFDEEEDVLPIGTILKVIAGTVVVTVGLCLIAWAFVAVGEARLRPSHQFPEEQLGAPHRVAGLHQQPFEVAQPRATLDEVKRKELGQFGWVDRPRGLVRIPIERALDWVAQDPSLIAGPQNRPALRKEAP